MQTLDLAAEQAATGIEAQLRRQEPLARHTTYRIGGPAELFLPAESAAAMVAGWRWAARRGLPCTLLGGGSNVIMPDQGLPGLVIKHRTTALPPLPADAPGDGLIIAIDAALVLARLSVWTVRHGWRGLEWAGGIPGTMAGAVIQNAGAHGGQLSDSLLDVTVLTPAGDLETWEPARLDLRYRHSIWRAPAAAPLPLICGLQLRLVRADRADLQAAVEHGQGYRRRTQPRGASAGSVFKNPPGDYAGRLIDQCGLKGTRVGGAVISPLHANWIINDTERATAADILALADLARQAVARRFGVTLQLEQQVIE
ncbi:MAG: UDP-N-acetylmuramate dehydrogenase [Chloroflexi bacterium]|nr:UDP-N-acetylmuramate dehydrogenase [Chloroflexota bacterium]